jgi:uncharacterized protein
LIVDCHIHIHGDPEQLAAGVERLLRHADRLDIEKLIVSLGHALCRRPDAARIQADTEYVLRAIECAPDRLDGLIYGSPNNVDMTLKLMQSHIASGPLKGVKLWVCQRCCHPGCDPIAALAAELGVPILAHTWLKTTGNMPGESTPHDLVQLATRHPQTQFVMAHSGGNWERGLRVVADQPNIYTDLCGGDPEAGQTECAVQWLGAERVLFGSDATGRSMASQLGKVIGADISDRDRRFILAENALRVFRL